MQKSVKSMKSACASSVLIFALFKNNLFLNNNILFLNVFLTKCKKHNLYKKVAEQILQLFCTGLSKTTMKKIVPTGMKKVRSTAKPAFFGLIDSMNDPEFKLEEDEQIVVIKDKYPKARFHCLVLPKKDISSINKVTTDDLDLLKHMESIANKYLASHKEYEFQVGYHALPSMHRLHLHVISMDFDSPHLKTKQHWNTFTTPYFLTSKDVIKQLEENGQIKINTKENEQHLKRELKCHKCSYTPKTMPDLKRHILEHIPSI